MATGYTGYLIWDELEEYDISTGLVTGNVTPNIPSHPNYKAPVYNTEACPTGDFPYGGDLWYVISAYEQIPQMGDTNIFGLWIRLMTNYLDDSTQLAVSTVGVGSYYSTRVYYSYQNTNLETVETMYIVTPTFFQGEYKTDLFIEGSAVAELPQITSYEIEAPPEGSEVVVNNTTYTLRYMIKNG